MNQPPHTYLQDYSKLGFDTMPLSPGGKEATLKNWPNLSSRQMWQKAPDGANIGIRCGGASHVAVIDCDDKTQAGTFENVKRYLVGLGLSPGDYPLVQTSSGIGKHIYITLSGEIDGSYRNLSSDFGSGEFRFGSGAYVVAPPSVIYSGGFYKLIAGDFSKKPCLEINDVLPLIGNQKITETLSIAELNIPKREIPKNTLKLLKGLNVKKYDSRSEHEQAILMGLVNSGHTFDEVLELLKKYPAAGKFRGKFSINPEDAIRWITPCYQNALKYYTNESPGRKQANQVAILIFNKPWNGAFGLYDKYTLLALARIGFIAGTIDNIAASCRTLAEMTGTSPNSVINRIKSLIKLGYVTKVKNAVSTDAAVYRIVIDRLLEDAQVNTLPHSINSILSVWKCIDYCQHDVFCTKGLGKTALDIYSFLNIQPMSLDELHIHLGKDKRAIKQAINKMTQILDSTTSELLDMVKLQDGNYYPNDIDLDLIARIIGVFGTGQRRKEIHERERADYKEYLEQQKVDSC